MATNGHQWTPRGLYQRLLDENLARMENEFFGRPCEPTDFVNYEQWATSDFLTGRDLSQYGAAYTIREPSKALVPWRPDSLVW